MDTEPPVDTRSFEGSEPLVASEPLERKPPKLFRVFALGLGLAAVLVIVAAVLLNWGRTRNVPVGPEGGEQAPPLENADTSSYDPSLPTSVESLATIPAIPASPAVEPRATPATPAAEEAAFDLTKPYKDAAGPIAIAQSTSLTLRDDARSKDLTIRVTLPSGDGPFPVVLFSHGLFGSGDNYQPLAKHWASHGYAVIQPTHEDSLKENLRATLDERTSEWRSRAEDMLFLLDQFDTIATKTNVPAAVFDRERICVAGHSFGAHTSTLLAGASARTGIGRREKLTDPRIDCAIWLSPQGTSFLLDASAYAAITMPLLAITGSEDTSPIQATLKATDRRKGYDLVAGDMNTWLVWVEGLYHGMGGIAANSGGQDARYQGSGGPNPTHVRIVLSATTAFLDAQLRESSDAKVWLTGPGLAAMSDGKAKPELR